MVDSCITKFNNGDELVLGICQQKWNYLYIGAFVQMILKVIENSNAEGAPSLEPNTNRVMNLISEYAMKSFATGIQDIMRVQKKKINLGDKLG